jgi:hypothetical protein
MTYRSKRVVRYIPTDNVKYLPEGRSMFLTKLTKRPGLVKVELDFDWVRNNTGMYEKLVGRR